MSTGVTCAEDVSSTFEDFKLQRGEFKGVSYITYKMDSKNSTIIIDKIAEKDEGYESFAAYISGTDCRYAVVDVPVVTDDGRETSKLVFISWIPDTAKVRSKMLYAGSKEYLKCAMPGIAIAVNCTDHADLDYESNIKPVCLKYA